MWVRRLKSHPHFFYLIRIFTVSLPILRTITPEPVFKETVPLLTVDIVNNFPSMVYAKTRVPLERPETLTEPLLASIFAEDISVFAIPLVPV